MWTNEAPTQTTWVKPSLFLVPVIRITEDAVMRATEEGFIRIVEDELVPFEQDWESESGTQTIWIKE